MPQLNRRALLPAALVSAAGAAHAAELSPVAAAAEPSRVVAAGADREARVHAVGVSSTAFKVLTRETRGDMFVMEQSNQRQGGPPRHLHHGEDELFYVQEGRYDVEVGGQRSRLSPGDCVLGPRGVPHAWAFTGTGRGRMLLVYAPAGKMEAFFNSRESLGIRPGGYSKPGDAGDMAILRAFGMEPVGPPLTLDAA